MPPLSRMAMALYSNHVAPLQHQVCFSCAPALCALFQCPLRHCTTGQLESVAKSTYGSCSRKLQELLSLSKNENKKRSLPHGPLFYPYLCLLVLTSTVLDDREIKKG